MQILPFKIPKPTNAAILFQVDQGSFYNALHHHEELQISFIKKGEGTLIAGDTLHSFSEGDLFVLGGYQPHVFNSNTNHSLMHSIFLSLEALGGTFLSLEEGKEIEEFYAFAKAGFTLKVTSAIKQLFERISTSKGAYRLGLFIELLLVLRTARQTPLTQFTYERHISEKDGKRMSAIFDFTMQHYFKEIHLDELAKLTAMTPQGFCKFFKQRTNKTYFTFLTEVRIGQACRLLTTHRELSIAEVAHRCGYKTLSHFNSCFKRLNTTTPSNYRELKMI